MKISETDLDLIKRFEGLETKAYHSPAGILTFGYGHTAGVKEGISEQSEAWLREDCQVAELTISSNVDVQLNQNQYDALVSFIFNLGSVNFIKSTLLKKLNAGDYPGAADEFDRWVNAGGRRSPVAGADQTPGSRKGAVFIMRWWACLMMMLVVAVLLLGWTADHYRNRAERWRKDYQSALLLTRA